MVCAADLLTDLEQRPEAQQLLHSLTSYMQSSDFKPAQEIKLSELFKVVRNQEIRD